MEEIKSITEAYSQMPITLEVSTQERYDNHKNPDAAKNFIKEIKLEVVTKGSSSVGVVFMAYVGYGFTGKKLFEYKADSMNVTYYP